MGFLGRNKKKGRDPRKGRDPQQSVLKPVQKYANAGIQPDAYVQMDDRDDISARISAAQADWASYMSRDDNSDRIVSNRSCSFDTESKDWYPRKGAPVGTTCTTASRNPFSCTKGSAHDTESKDWYPRTGAPVGTTGTTAPRSPFSCTKGSAHDNPLQDRMGGADPMKTMGAPRGTTTEPFSPPAVQRLTAAAFSCTQGSAHDTPQQDPTPGADPVKNSIVLWHRRMGALVGTTTACLHTAMKQLAAAVAAVGASCNKGGAHNNSQKDGTPGADPVKNSFLPSFKLRGFPPAPSWAIPAAAVATLVTCAALSFALPTSRGWTNDISVAFIGNNVLSDNDVPRFLEALGEGHITQNSCMHANVSLAAITETGNGMYDLYKTDNAKVTDDEDFHNCYDFGACTVNQLLLGNDDDLLYDNANGAYYSDGQNPCFQQVAYLWYLQKLYQERGAPNWDFIILADQTKRTFFNRTRQEILGALKDEYIPILGETGATPVFVVTHAFSSSSVNMTVFRDIPTFTSRVYYGYQQYAAFLKEQLPESQEPRLAPVGLAFLVVWEEDRDMWKKLFYNSELPSPYGSYLYGVILFHTLVGRMPTKAVALPKDMSTLWDRARIMKFGDNQDGDDQGTGIPTREEASYLFDVAERVASLDYRPQSFINFTAILEFN